MSQSANRSEIVEIIERLAEQVEQVEYMPVEQSTNMLAYMNSWYSKRYGCPSKSLSHPRIVIFSSAHGFAKTLNLGNDTHASYIEKCTKGMTALNRLCGQIDCDLRIYELDQIGGTDCFISNGQAMSETSFVSACSYGMMAMEENVGILGLRGMGTGADHSARIILAHLLNDQGLLPNSIKMSGISDPIELVIQYGGYELCSMLGAFLAAKLADKPILCEGLTGLALMVTLSKFSHKLLKDVFYVSGGSTDVDIPTIELPMDKCSAQPGTQLAFVMQNLLMINYIQKGEALIEQSEEILGSCGLNKIQEGLKQQNG